MKQLRAQSMMKPVNKWLLLLLLIAIVLTLWTAFISKNVDDEQTIVPSERKSSTTSANSINTFNKKQNGGNSKKMTAIPFVTNTKTALIPWQELNRKQMDSQPINIFKVYSWNEVPRVKKAASFVASAPVKPVAPIAPFTYMGQMQDTPKGTQVFLLNNGVLISVIKGEKINQQWRLDTQDETTLRLTYLPLNLTQILYKTATPADSVTPALSLDLNQPQARSANISQPNVSQPDISQSEIDSLNVDPPDTNELGLEELKL